MCDGDCEHYDIVGDPDLREDPSVALTRRGFGGLLVGAASVLTVARIFHGTTATAAEPVISADGLSPISNAMHVHTSFSEGAGSLGAQLSEAARNNVRVLWKTDHDWRELAHGAPQQISFTSLTKEDISGRPLAWRKTPSGALAESNGGIVTSPVSPHDSNPTPGALWVKAAAAGAAAASLRYYADFSSPRVSQRTNIGGQRLQIDVYPVQADGTDSYLEVLITLCYHPPLGGRPAGRYQISYRLGRRAAGHETQQLLGIVYKTVTLATWQEVTLDLVADVRLLWPDLIAEDNVLFDLWLGVTSLNQKLAEGYFDNLRFTRTQTSPDEIRTTEQALKSAYATRYPGVYLPRGREVSYYERHLNAFGSNLIADYSSTPTVWPNDPGWEFSTEITRQIKATGALVSFNHPFGTPMDPPSDAASQAAALQRVFHDLYANAVCGADILEVGYQQRGGTRINKTSVSADIGTHQELWDMLSRNGFYLTGNGVSDNHTGSVGRWAKEADRFITYTWTRSVAEADLVTALASGRVYVAELRSFTGILDLLVDGIVPMGAVSVRPGTSRRQLQVIAAGLPAGSGVQIVQCPVDYPGLQTPSSGKTVVQTLPASAFSTGSATVPLNTSRSSFVRVNVTTATGRTVAFSNPIWLLAEQSARPIPPKRVAPGEDR